MATLTGPVAGIRKSPRAMMTGATESDEARPVTVVACGRAERMANPTRPPGWSAVMRGSAGAVGAPSDRHPRTDQRHAAVDRLQTLAQDEPILHFRLAAIFAAQLFDFVTF